MTKAYAAILITNIPNKKSSTTSVSGSGAIGDMKGGTPTSGGMPSGNEPSGMHPSGSPGSGTTDGAAEK